MNKDKFLKLSLSEQIIYINAEMKQGNSFTHICKYIGISKGSLSSKFKKHNYKLEEGQYILEQIEGQMDILKSYSKNTKPKEEDKTRKTCVGIDTHDKGLKEEKSIIEPIKSKGDTKAIKRNVGRPQKHDKDSEGNNINKSKMTIEIDSDIITALRLKKALEKITLNDFIGDVLRENIDEKYFNMQK